MIYIQYDTDDEKKQCIQEQSDSGYYLVGYEYRIEGNFLVFDLQPMMIENPNATIEERVTVLEQTTNEILLGGI